MHVDDRLLLFKRHVGQLAAIRRPGRGNDRLGRGQGRRGPLAVGIGDLQQELAACLDDVGDARRENAFFAGQLFVDVVGNAMPGGAQLLIARHIGRPPQGHGFLRVVQAETGFQSAIQATRYAAANEGIGTLGLPVGQIDRRILVDRRIAVIDQLEQAAALQVGTHGTGDDAGRHAVAGKIGNGDRDAVGTGPGDFNGQLSLGEGGGRQRQGQENATGDRRHRL